MIVEEMGIRGIVNFVVRGPDGRVKQHKTVRNKVMNFGIAHIVGRMLDTNQAGYCSDTGSGAGGTYDTPAMMRFMGIGEGATPNAKGEIQASGGTVALGNIKEFYDDGTGVVTSQNLITGEINGTTGVKAGIGTEYRLQRELTTGASQQDPKPSSGSPSNLDGRVNMGATLSGSNQSREITTDLFQGAVNASGLLDKDTPTFTAEGTVTHKVNGTGATTFQIPHKVENKRTGTRLVFVALFPANSAIRSGLSGEVAVTEAGVFNGEQALEGHTTDATENVAGGIANQTMLCRTQFSVVTKQPADSLQITWSIEFSDNTA